MAFSAVGRFLGPGALHETGRATCHRHGRLLDQSGHGHSGRMVGKVDLPFCDQSPRVVNGRVVHPHCCSQLREPLVLSELDRALGRHHKVCLFPCLLFSW